LGCMGKPTPFDSLRSDSKSRTAVIGLITTGR
jgi:hypothetical protein